MRKKLFQGSITAFGLQKKPTYEDVANYIAKDPDKIKYPNKNASIIRNSFELSQLDGLGQLEIDRQHENVMRHQQRQILLQQFAEDHGLPLGEVRAYVENLGLHPVNEEEYQRIRRVNPNVYEQALPVREEEMPAPQDEFQQVQGAGGQLGPAEAVAEAPPVQLANLGGVIEQAPPPIHYAMAGGDSDRGDDSDSDRDELIRVYEGDLIAQAVRARLFPAQQLALPARPANQRRRVLFLPRNVFHPIAHAVIRGVDEHVISSAQLIAVQEEIQRDEDRRIGIQRVAQEARRIVAGTRRNMFRNMSADDALDLLIAEVNRRPGRDVEVRAIENVTPGAASSSGGASSSGLVRSAPKAIPKASVRVRGKQNHPNYRLS